MSMGKWVLITMLSSMTTACAGRGGGQPIDPDPMVESLPLESLYIQQGVQLVPEGLPSRKVSLRLFGRINSALKGMLILDPNQCNLDMFGDPITCTRIAARGIGVEVRRLTLTDSMGLGRKYFEVSAPELSGEVGLIVEGTLKPGEVERCYLVKGNVVVPLFLENGS